MTKANITIKFSDESFEALERFTAALAETRERVAALLPEPCEDGHHVWTSEVCSLVEECAHCATTRHKSGIDEGTKGDPCPCGCRRDVEPKPLVSRDLTEMQDRINATLSDPNIDAALNTVRHVGVTGVHEAGGCAECSEPEPDAVTVTLLNPPGMAETWREYADHADEQGCLREVGDMLRNVADALDAATQGAGDAEDGCECRYVGGMEEVAVCGQCLGRSQS